MPLSNLNQEQLNSATANAGKNKTQNNYDKIATRLALILTKLNSAESFTIEELMQEYNVSKRTIQRDSISRFERQNR
jgi:transcriptional antiterminator